MSWRVYLLFFHDSVKRNDREKRKGKSARKVRKLSGKKDKQSKCKSNLQMDRKNTNVTKHENYVETKNVDTLKWLLDGKRKER